MIETRGVKMNVLEMNVLVLAYLGDTIYEDYVRKHLILSGIGNVKDLQIASISYVSAKAQAKFLMNMMEASFFTEEELHIIMRARNYKSNAHPKNCDIMTYKYATGLEALIGALELSGKKERIAEIMSVILEGKTLC